MLNFLILFSNRWKLLKPLINGCAFMTSDRIISHSQFLLLFEAFLLQVKEMEGTVYIVPSEKNSPLATHFADSLTNILHISARGLIPVHKNVPFHLASLLKKNDLLITLGSLGHSTNTLTVAATAKADIPLITLTGGQKGNPLSQQGDLSAYFDTIDQNLIQTGQFSLLSSIVDAWTYSSQLSTPKQELFSPRTQPQTMLMGLRI